MKRSLVLLVIFTALLALFPATSALAGSAASCSVSPTHGLPGTNFAFSCSGFSPNTIVNIWASDPSGVAQAAGVVPGAPNSVKTDAGGSASFVWTSPGGTNHPIYTPFPFAVDFAVELGDWTWYVQQLCYGKACIVGSATVHIDSGSLETIAGANVTVTPSSGFFGDKPGSATTFHLVGSGFAPGEYVDLWVTQPPGCDTDNNFFSSSADSLNTFTNELVPNSLKADASGTIAISFTLFSENCVGTYYVTARALGSGAGGIGWFTVTGAGITGTFGETHTLTVNPSAVQGNLLPEAFAMTVSGSGYAPGEGVSCWVTRPDTRTEGSFNGKADASGSIAIAAIGADIQSVWPLWSAQPGEYTLTCRGNSSGVTQFGHFTVVGAAVDP
jgi:hypothetical protein